MRGINSIQLLKKDRYFVMRVSGFRDQENPLLKNT